MRRAPTGAASGASVLTSPDESVPGPPCKQMMGTSPSPSVSTWSRVPLTASSIPAAFIGGPLARVRSLARPAHGFERLIDPAVRRNGNEPFVSLTRDVHLLRKVEEHVR